ncbi:rhodopsin [Aplysia californica]|uniref:Rhodopsin n=1 Tax=Aplysia californica TaxID=6500 RepID=A0ABM1VQ94_APLCA|nr:rhodopsin [Aplysia californica]XP_012935613.1 rhodopsin [Aplysia californica]XP_035824586.1 rhodopsin [Aplysia californica]
MNWAKMAGPSTNGVVTMNVSSSLTSQPYHELLHPHWLEHEEAPEGVHLSVGVFITLVGVLAVCGNSLVIITCIRFKDLRTRSNILIINLAVGDLLMCLIDFPLLAAASFYGEWPYGRQVCQMYAFLTAIAGLVTINTLAVIAADRYWAVVRRPTPGQKLPKCVTSIAVASVWAYSISWALCPILGWGAYVLDGIRTTCTFDFLTRTWENRSFVIGMMIGNFVLPFALMVFSYFRIWVAVRKVKSGLERESSHIAMGTRRFSSDSCRSHRLYKRGGGRFSFKTNSSTGSEFYKNEEVPKGDDIAEETRDVNCNEQQLLDNALAKIFKPVREGSNVEDSSKCNVNDKHFDHKQYFKSFKSANEQNRISRLSEKMRQSEDTFDTSTTLPLRCLSSNHKKLERGITVPQDKSRLYSELHQSGLSKTTFHSNGETKRVVRYPQRKYTSVPTLSETQRSSSTLSISRWHRNVFCAIRHNYNLALGSTLFVKQHRYRLHCEQKTVKIIMFLLIAFTVSWSPYLAVSIIGLFGDRSQLTYQNTLTASLIAKTSMVFNPILYSISHPKVRKRIANLACCYSVRRHQQQTSRIKTGRRSTSSATPSRS